MRVDRCAISDWITVFVDKFLNWLALIFTRRWRRSDTRKWIMQPGIPIDQMNGEIAWKGKHRRSGGNSCDRPPLARKLLSVWLFATLRTGRKESRGSEKFIGERSTLKETRNENVFPDVYRQIENPNRRLCERASVAFRSTLNGPFG